VTAICLNAWWIRRQDGGKIYDDQYYNWYFKELSDKVRIVYLTDRETSPVIQESLSPIEIDGFWQKIDGGGFDVHINSNTPISGYFVAKTLDMIGVPTVFDICDDLPHRFRTSTSIPSPLRPLGGFIGRLMLERNIRMIWRISLLF